MQTRFRVYFYDAETRQELSAHPLNGTEWAASGATTPESRGTAHPVRTDMEVVVSREPRYQTRHVTAADFGGKPVLVKRWHPASSEMFTLAPVDHGFRCAYCGEWKSELDRRIGYNRKAGDPCCVAYRTIKPEVQAMMRQAA